MKNRYHISRIEERNDTISVFFIRDPHHGGIGRHVFDYNADIQKIKNIPHAQNFKTVMCAVNKHCDETNGERPDDNWRYNRWQQMMHFIWPDGGSFQHDRRHAEMVRHRPHEFPYSETIRTHQHWWKHNTMEPYMDGAYKH